MFYFLSKDAIVRLLLCLIYESNFATGGGEEGTGYIYPWFSVTCEWWSWECLLKLRRDYTVSLSPSADSSSPGELTLLKEASAPVPDLCLRKSVPAWPPVASIKVKVPCL